MVTERPDNPEEIFACTRPSLPRSVSRAMCALGSDSISALKLQAQKCTYSGKKAKVMKGDGGISLALFAKKLLQVWREMSLNHKLPSHGEKKNDKKCLVLRLFCGD